MHHVTLEQLIEDIADVLVRIDALRPMCKTFAPGIGPFGEIQLVSLIKDQLNTSGKYNGRIVTKRTPDLLIPTEWAIEFKIVRPYGDNGRPAEHWSVNMLHPYPGNQSTIGHTARCAPRRPAAARNENPYPFTQGSAIR
jgi:hypothetical protein